MSNEKIPALCPKSASPYVYCPLKFEHSDDMILSYVSMLVTEVRRLNRLPIHITIEDAQMIDRYGGEITAYMNGRIHELVRMLKEKEATNV
jgi:hypothetical protein